MVVMWGTFNTFGVFFKPLLTDFGWTRAMTSGAFSLSSIVFGFLNIVAGRLTDRFGPRMIMIAFGFFLGLGYLLMSQISAIWQLYLFYGVLVGIGMGGSIVPLASTIARWFVRRRAMMTGIIFAGMGLGTTIMPPVANRLISTYGWQTSYIIVGIMALVLIISAAQFLRRDPSQMGQLPYGASEVREESLKSGVRGFSLREAIHTRQFWLLSAMYFCFLFCGVSITVHIIVHAIGQGVSATIAANTLAVIGGASIASMVVMGNAADRIGIRSGFIIAFILMSVALFCLLGAKGVWMLFLSAAIFGLAYGSLQVLFSPLVAELFGLSSHGVILGIAAFAGNIGAAVGPVLAGRIFDITTSYNLAFLTCGGVGIIGLILTLLLRPAHRQDLMGNM